MKAATKGGRKLPSVYSARNATEAERCMILAGIDYSDVGKKAHLSPFSVREYCRRGCPHPATGEALAKAIPGIRLDFFCDKWREGAGSRTSALRTAGR